MGEEADGEEGAEGAEEVKPSRISVRWRRFDKWNRRCRRSCRKLVKSQVSNFHSLFTLTSDQLCHPSLNHLRKNIVSRLKEYLSISFFSNK